MLPSHPLPLRSALASLKAQPLLMTPCCATSNPIQQRRFFKSPTRPSTRTTHTPRQTRLLRLESTTTTASTPLTPTPSSASSSTTPPPPPPPSHSDLQPLTWNAYLSLRKTRRRYNLVSSLLSSAATTAGGMTALTTFNMDQMNVFGLDPVVVLGLITAGSGGVGWLLGPFLGNAVFGMAHRRVGAQIAEKEKDFYRRIKKHRVDPSGGSSANPVPDYYGEKIGSVKEYRNWLKDQRAFNKRRQNFL